MYSGFGCTTANKKPRYKKKRSGGNATIGGNSCNYLFDGVSHLRAPSLFQALTPQGGGGSLVQVRGRHCDSENGKGVHTCEITGLCIFTGCGPYSCGPYLSTRCCGPSGFGFTGRKCCGCFKETVRGARRTALITIVGSNKHCLIHSKNPSYSNE